MRMAEISRGSRPSDLRRLKVSRQEIPASTRIRALELSTIAQFPRLPLASIETQTPMSLEHTFNYCESGSNFLVKPYFRAKSLGAGSALIQCHDQFDRSVPVGRLYWPLCRTNSSRPRPSIPPPYEPR